MPFDISKISSEIFTKEIFAICKSLQDLDIDLEKQPLRAEPSWLGTPSVREKILIDKFFEQTGTSENEKKDKRDLYLVCAASFDIDTNYKNFDVDHFFPKAEILYRLEQLITNNSQLLRETKQKLLKDCESHGISKSVIEKLIIIKAKGIDIIGLKLVYYNYPKNLEPISRTSNISKGQREPIENLIYVSLTNLYHLTKDEEYIKSLLRKDGVELQVTNIEDYIKEAAENIRNNLEIAFIGQYAVIPHDAQGRSILEAFKHTNVGKVCENYAMETARNIRQMLLLTRGLTALSISDDLEIRKQAERGEKAIEIFRKALAKALNLEASPFKGRVSAGTKELIGKVEFSMEAMLEASSSEQEALSKKLTKLTEEFKSGVKPVEEPLKEHSSDLSNEDPVQPPKSKPKPAPKHTFSHT